MQGFGRRGGRPPAVRVVGERRQGPVEQPHGAVRILPGKGRNGAPLARPQTLLLARQEALELIKIKPAVSVDQRLRRQNHQSNRVGCILVILNLTRDHSPGYPVERVVVHRRPIRLGCLSYFQKGNQHCRTPQRFLGMILRPWNAGSWCRGSGRLWTCRHGVW